jgi:hypothetical protein
MSDSGRPSPAGGASLGGGTHKMLLCVRHTIKFADRLGLGYLIRELWRLGFWNLDLPASKASG